MGYICEAVDGRLMMMEWESRKDCYPFGYRFSALIPIDAAKIHDQIIDQSPIELIESKDGFQPLGHKHNHETTHKLTITQWNS